MSSESPPTVFISYSHDSDEHKAWVRKLTDDLIRRGVNALLDQYEIGPGDNLQAFMERGASRSDRVVLVCTDGYNEKFDNFKGMVAYEKVLITDHIVENATTSKVVPIVKTDSPEKSIPKSLGRRLYIDFCDEENYERSCLELASELLGKRPKKPTIGSAKGSRSIQQRDFAIPFTDDWRVDELAVAMLGSYLASGPSDAPVIRIDWPYIQSGLSP